MRLDANLTDETVLKELGARLAELRLNRNLTQSEVAEQAAITRPTVVRIEKGLPTDVTSFIRVLRALNLVDRLDTLVPEQSISPIQRADLVRETRKRARKPREKSAPGRGWKWGDE